MCDWDEMKTKSSKLSKDQKYFESVWAYGDAGTA